MRCGGGPVENERSVPNGRTVPGTMRDRGESPTFFRVRGGAKEGLN